MIKKKLSIIINKNSMISQLELRYLNAVLKLISVEFMARSEILPKDSVNQSFDTLEHFPYLP